MEKFVQSHFLGDFNKNGNDTLELRNLEHCWLILILLESCEYNK